MDTLLFFVVTLFVMGLVWVGILVLIYKKFITKNVSREERLGLSMDRTNRRKKFDIGG